MDDAPRLTAFGQASRPDWDRLVRGSDEATFYHRFAWNDACAETARRRGRRARAVAWHARFGDGVEAIFPCNETAGRWGRIACSSAETTYGGWIGGPGFTAAHDALAWLELPYRHLIVRTNPFQSHHSPRRVDASFLEATAVLDLRPGFAAINADWNTRKAAVLRNSKLAAKCGIRTALAETVEDWRRFHEIYTIASRRWGSPRVRSLDSLLLLRSESDGDAHLWLAWDGSAAVGGAVTLANGQHVAGLIRGATPEGYRRNAPSALDIAMISHYALAGFRWFDLDGSPGMEAAHRYKLDLGAVEMPMPVQTLFPAPYRQARLVWHFAKRLFAPGRRRPAGGPVLAP
jgi:hypothetical protein